MKVYFEASIAGKREYEENYRLIINKLEEMGHKVNQSMMDVDVKSLMVRKSSQDEEIYKEILQSIRDSDVFICDMTYGSPGVAMEVQDAIHRYKKPSLILYHKSKKGRPAAPFLGNPSKLLHIERYDKSDLESVLRRFLNKAGRTIPSQRFTVRMHEELNEYVEYLQVLWKETSKNKVVKRLLESRMEEDNGYQNFLKERQKEL